MAESPYQAPMDIARGLQELASFIRSCGFAQAARLVDAAADEARKQIAPITDRVDREIATRRARRASGGGHDLRGSLKAARR